MEPTVVDNRDLHTSIQAQELLERIIPHLEPNSLVGIRKIILLDEDPIKKRSKYPARARYKQLGNTRRGDVWLFFSHLDSLEKALRENEMYVTFMLTRSLVHELYHHSVRGRRIKRRPKRAVEERAATDHAQSVATHVARSLFPEHDHQELWDSMREAIDRRKNERDST